MADQIAQDQYALDNVFDFVELLECDYRCIQLLEKIRWRNGFVCPKCNADKGYRVPEYRLIQCAKCRHQTSATSGTIFHKSHLGLRKWFFAILLLLSDKSGLSAQRLHLTIGVSYKTALSMLKKLRALMGIQNHARSGEVDFSFLMSVLKASANCPVEANFVFSRRQAVPETGLSVDENPCSSPRTDQDNQAQGKNFSRIINIEDPGLSNNIRQGSVERVPSKSELMSVAGALALARHFFLGTFHRSSSRYLQLYFDEFVYRYKESRVQTMIIRFLAECCQTSSTIVSGYLERIVKSRGRPGNLSMRQGNVGEEVAEYRTEWRTLLPGFSH